MDYRLEFHYRFSICLIVLKCCLLIVINCYTCYYISLLSAGGCRSTMRKSEPFDRKNLFVRFSKRKALAILLQGSIFPPTYKQQ